MKASLRDKETILIVDDTHDNLRLLSKVLSKSGYSVRPAPTAKLALAAAFADPPDLILLDINMPEMNGFEVCEKLKQVEATKDIPVVFVSALGETFNKVKAFEVGGVDYVTKPFQIEEVIARVSSHLELRQLRQTLAEQNQQLSQEVEQRKQAQEKLEHFNEELETRVKQRTLALEAEVEERNRTQNELVHLAFHDPLTELPNRRYFLQQLDECLGVSDFSVVLLDIDGFKVFNDSLGPELGDELLHAIAKRLNGLLPEKAMLTRLGGDEFAYLLNTNAKEEVIKFAKNVLLELNKPLRFNVSEFYLNASIGITFSDLGYDTASHLLRDADTAMYQAKAGGKGAFRIFDSSMQSLAQERLELEADLRHALAIESTTDQQLELYFQPIVSLQGGLVGSFEALLRWKHPRKGMVSPLKFIPIAEETGLIQRLGWWVLKTACVQISDWRERLSKDICVNVNLSTLQLKQPNFVKQFEALLQDYGIEAHNLKLEITESAILEDAKLLAEISKLGIAICIDDFGTGHSSLSRLQEFPIHTIKIDRSFVMKLDQSKEGAAMAAMIIAMAKGLGCEVVAEGIETLKQLERLQILSCRLGQGYYFSKPVDAATASSLFSAHAAVA